MLINFEIPGIPVAKARSRSASKNGKTFHYTPKKTENYENLVKVSAYQAMKGKTILDCPVCLRAELFVPVPESWSSKKKQQALNHEIMPTTRPDCSNLLKSIEDGMNGVVYKDDKQIVQIKVLKQYSDKPRAEITVQEFVWCGF